MDTKVNKGLKIEVSCKSSNNFCIQQEASSFREVYMIICNICDREFETVKDLAKHLIKDHEYDIGQVYSYFNYSFETGEATCPICGKNFIMTKRQIHGFKKNPNKSIGCCTSCSKAVIMLTHESPLAKEEIKEKIKQTNLERRGVEYPAQSKEVLEKMKKTNLKIFGVENASQAKEVQEKRRKTNLKKFGTEVAIGSKELRDKAQATIRDKYGVENVFQSEEIKDKIKSKHLFIRGVAHPMKSEEIKKKVRETNKERRGVEYPLQSKESQEKMKATNLKRRGVEYLFQLPEIIEDIKRKTRETNLKRHGVEYFCQHEKCYNASHKRISKINKKFQKFLNENNIESELEFVLDNYGYDLKVGNTLVEINPTFTHNSTIGPNFGNNFISPKPIDYHLEKTKIANENGYDCVHVFDWDDLNKIQALLMNRENIPARKCSVKEISKKEAKEFLEKYHLQGSTRSVLYSYGLFYENKLVQVMTFGSPRYNKNYEYELLRLCTIPGISVVGGASKLLKYFETRVKPASLLSYCDLSKFNGKIYEILGFTLGSTTPPAKHWYNKKTKRHITDNLLRQRGFDQLHGTSFGKGTNNEVLMLEHSYVEIYDCGQLVFVKK